MPSTEPPRLRGETLGEQRIAHASETGSSAKIEQLVHLLSLTPKTEKSLVFSQFTAFLDKIEDALDEADIIYCRFDGQMSARQRQETLDAFSEPLCEDHEVEVVSPSPSRRTRSSLSTSPSTPILTRASRSRLRMGPQKRVFDEDEDEDVVDGDGHGDDDFDDDLMRGAVGDGGGRSYDNHGARNGNAKGKGKMEARDKGKGKAACSSARSARVMLVSLKVSEYDCVICFTNAD